MKFYIVKCSQNEFPSVNDFIFAVSLKMSPCHCYVWISNSFQPIFFSWTAIFFSCVCVYCFRCCFCLFVSSFNFCNAWRAFNTCTHAYLMMIGRFLLTLPLLLSNHVCLHICKCNLEWISDEFILETKRRSSALKEKFRFGRSVGRGSHSKMC